MCRLFTVYISGNQSAQLKLSFIVAIVCKLIDFVCLFASLRAGLDRFWIVVAVFIRSVSTHDTRRRTDESDTGRLTKYFRLECIGRVSRERNPL